MQKKALFLFSAPGMIDMLDTFIQGNEKGP